MKLLAFLGKNVTVQNPVLGGFFCVLVFFKVRLHSKIQKNGEVKAAAGEDEGEMEPADRQQNSSI